MKYEIAIAVDNKPHDLQRKEGDIIAIVPYPHNWGYKEIDQYFILIVDIAADYKYLRTFLTRRKFATPGDDTTEWQAKREFTIPLDNLKTNHLPNLDLVKVRDITKKYQPCKSATQLISKLDLELKDIDCDMTGVSGDTEVTINFANNIIFNKTDNKYIASV